MVIKITNTVATVIQAVSPLLGTGAGAAADSAVAGAAVAVAAGAASALTTAAGAAAGAVCAMATEPLNHKPKPSAREAKSFFMMGNSS